MMVTVVLFVVVVLVILSCDLCMGYLRVDTEIENTDVKGTGSFGSTCLWC